MDYIKNNKRQNSSIEYPVLIQKFFSMVKIGEAIISKWQEQLKSRFEQNFSFLVPSEKSGLESFIVSIMQISETFFKLSDMVIKENLIQRPKIKTANSPNENKKSLDEYTIKSFKKNLPSSGVQKIKEENYHLFTSFITNTYFKKENLNTFDKKIEFPDFLKEICSKLKRVRGTPSLMQIIGALEKRAKQELKSLTQDQVGIIESGILSDNKTISFKRVHQLNESRENESAKKTIQKKHYTSDMNGASGGRFQGRDKLPIAGSPDISNKSINSNKVHVEQYDEQNRLKQSELLVDINSLDTSEMLNKQLSPQMAVKKDKNLIKNMTISNTKSYTSNIFKSVRPNVNLMHSQNFPKTDQSQKTLGLRESKMVGVSHVHSHLYSDLKQSPQLIVQKKKNRKQMIEFPCKPTHNYSPSINLTEQNINYSIEMRNTIESKDIGSIDKMVANTLNPFAFMSDVYSKDILPEFLNTKKSGKFKTSQNLSRVSLMHVSEAQKKRPTMKAKKGARKESGKKGKGHQKFASVNLDFLRLQNAKKLNTVQQSEISHVIEDNKKMRDIISQINRGESNVRKKDKGEKTLKNLVRMKSMITNKSSKNYTKMLSSYMGKSKMPKRLKSKQKKKIKLSMIAKKNPHNADNLSKTGNLISSIRPKKKTDSELFNRRNTFNFQTSLDARNLAKKKSERLIPGMRTINPRTMINQRKPSRKNRTQMRSIQVPEKGGSKQENKKVNPNRRPHQNNQKKPANKPKNKKASISKKIKNLSYFLGTKNSEASEPNKVGSISKNYKKQYRFKLKKADVKKKKTEKKNLVKMTSSLVNKMKPTLLVNSGEVAPGKNRKNLKYYFSYLGGSHLKEIKKKKPRDKKRMTKEFNKTQVI